MFTCAFTKAFPYMHFNLIRIILSAVFSWIFIFFILSRTLQKSNRQNRNLIFKYFQYLFTNVYIQVTTLWTDTVYSLLYDILWSFKRFNLYPRNSLNCYLHSATARSILTSPHCQSLSMSYYDNRFRVSHSSYCFSFEFFQY